MYTHKCFIVFLNTEFQILLCILSDQKSPNYIKLEFLWAEKTFFLGGVALFCCHRKTNRRTKLWNIKEADWILMRNATQILLQLSRRPWVYNSLNTSCALIQAFTDAVYQLHITTCSSEILSHIIVLHILIALCSCRCMLHKCFHRKKWRNP